MRFFCSKKSANSRTPHNKTPQQPHATINFMACWAASREIARAKATLSIAHRCDYRGSRDFWARSSEKTTRMATTTDDEENDIDDSSQATTLQSAVWKEWLKRKGKMTQIWTINGTGDMMSDSKSKGSGPLEANEVEVDEQRIRRRRRRWQMGVQRRTWLNKIIYV